MMNFPNTRSVKYIVMDEADRLLELGFLDQVGCFPRRIPFLLSPSIAGIRATHNLCVNLSE
jgi:hypothetical protein